MILIKFTSEYDYGQNYYVQTLFTKRRAFFQGSVTWCENPGWPCFLIKFGMGSLMTLSFDVYKFGLFVSLFDSTWKLDYDKTDFPTQTSHS